MKFRSPTVRAIAALSLTQLIGWGATFNLPAVIGPAIAADLTMPLPLIMAGPTIMLIIMALLSWPLSTIFEQRGARPLMILGSALGALGLCVMSAANSTAVYFLAWGILGFAGAGMLTTPAQVALAEIAGDKARQALSALMLASGLTSTISWPISAFLQAQIGWRSTLVLYAVLMLVLCVPLHWAALARRPRQISRTDPTATTIAIDRPRFVLLAVSFAANGFVTWGFSLAIIILFEAAGLDHATALGAAALIGLAQWIARIADFLAGRHWSGLVIAVAAALLFPISFTILLISSNVIGAVIFAVIYGMAGGTTAIARSTLPLQVFPPGAYARASAQLALPLNLSFAAAPPIFTAVITSAGPHAALWLALAISVFAFASLLALLLLHQPRD